MGRKIFIFCEECGARLEVDENDPRVFCEECGAEIENVRYRPEEDAEIFEENTEGPFSIFAATEESVENVEESIEEVEPTQEEVTEFTEVEEVATDNGPDLYEEYHEEYNIREYTEEDREVDEAIKYAVENMGMLNAVETAYTKNIEKNTVVNNYVTTKSGITKMIDSNGNVVEPKEDVKEIFVDHEYVEKVTEGTPVTYYAVIERRGRFFTGECPEIPFTSTGLENSFEECLEEIKDEVEERVNSFGGKDYHQPSYDELQSAYPQADIVEITVLKKR